MLHANNPLAHGSLDDEPDDPEIYGYDPEGPSPQEHNNVVVEPVTLDNSILLESYVLEIIDPLRPSTQLGIDIYTQALELLRERMDQIGDQ